ncbi:hypothetical protein BS78_06G183500 [Paspalum vaginatum]|nr:hypothetical protein BS78_06G183500 [Paspalum vaginatum]
MDTPPATQVRRANTVAERKLDELCACLEAALSSRKRGADAERRLLAEIKAKTDFLRSLLAAEAECHGGARPEHLAEAEARFAVLEATFDQWARRAASAPEPVEEEVVGEPEEEGTDCSGSTCSCTDSCQETAAAGNAVEASKEGASGAIADGSDAECQAAEKRREAASDAITKKREAMGTREEVTPDAIAKKRDADGDAAAKTRRTTQRRWWMRSAAWCGAAGVVTVFAIGLAVGFAAVAHHNVTVYVVPT